MQLGRMVLPGVSAKKYQGPLEDDRVHEWAYKGSKACYTTSAKGILASYEGV